VGAVGHAHGVGAPADAGDPHQRLRACAPAASSLRSPSSLQSTAAAAPSDMTQMSRRVRGQATIGAVAHVGDGQPLPLLRVRVVEGVHVVLDGDVGHLLGRGAELLHVARDHHRVVARVEAADRIVEAHVRGQGDELVALPRLDVAHRLEAIGQADVHVARGHRLPRFLEADAAGGAAALDAVAGLGHQAQVILGHDAGHQLAAEMIREIRSDAAVDNREELALAQPEVASAASYASFTNAGNVLSAVLS
jgi:hypothetical protein